MAAQNVYGDTLTATVGDFGANISSQRVDDLDHAALLEAYNGNAGAIADLGCGDGLHTLRMALSGRETIGIDQNDESERFAIWGKTVPSLKLKFLKADFGELQVQSFPPNLQIAYSQRSLNYLPYAAQQQLLKTVFDGLSAGGKLFASSGGLETEYGITYPHRDLAPESRFAMLAPDMAQKHGIQHPNCLLTSEEFQILVESAGFKAEKVWRSPFGNNKGIFTKTP
ncbi:MAG: methyltransferase domain-containing protein [Alphaproteobacteria bacterium]|nr:methyltransferase domain-containing protein [Alphaproteobacteria bacterium]